MPCSSRVRVRRILAAALCSAGSKHELHTISSSRSFVAAFSSGSDSKSYKQQGNHSIVIKAANTSYTPSPQAGPLWQPSARDQTQSPTSNNGIILLLSRQQTRVTHHLLKQVLCGSLQLGIRLKVLQATMESFYCYQGSKHELHTISSSRSFVAAFSSGSDSKSYKQQWNPSIVIKAANTSYTPSPQAGPLWQPSARDQTQSPTSNNGIILLLSRQQTRVTHHLL